MMMLDLLHRGREKLFVMSPFLVVPESWLPERLCAAVPQPFGTVADFSISVVNLRGSTSEEGGLFWFLVSEALVQGHLALVF